MAATNMSFSDHSTETAGLQGISRTTRDLPPADFLLKLLSFSSIKDTLQKYDSDVFEAGGHKWKLCVYPNGNKEENGKGYISLYLIIVETDTYHRNWEVPVNFRLFVFDQKYDKYLTLQEDANGGAIRRFCRGKTEWGFAKLISHEDFYNPSNGFIVDDFCIFGVEVDVLCHSKVEQFPSRYIVEAFPKDTFTWDVKRFSKRDNWNYIESQVFVIGDLVWTLMVYPRGYDGGFYGREGHVTMCLCLHPQQEISLPYWKEVSIEYKMSILNKDETKHLERPSSGRVQLTKRSSCCWEENIISVKELQEASRGFIKNDILTVEVQISIL